MSKLIDFRDKFLDNAHIIQQKPIHGGEMEGVPEIVKFLGWIGSILSMLFWAAVRFARLEFIVGQTRKDVDTLQDFIMRRGLVEALNKGVVTMNSPISAPKTTIEMFGNLVEELRAWYAKNKQRFIDDVKDRKLFMAIEAEFGDRIAVNVCRPNNLNVGACIIAAMAICRIPDPKADSDVPTDTKLKTGE